MGVVASTDENGKAADPGEEESHGPRECMPCRGTGRVVSNLGGTPKDVTCPWCDGSGMRQPDVDAQARWPHDEAASQVSVVPAETE